MSCHPTHRISGPANLPAQRPGKRVCGLLSSKSWILHHQKHSSYPPGRGTHRGKILPFPPSEVTDGEPTVPTHRPTRLRVKGPVGLQLALLQRLRTQELQRVLKGFPTQNPENLFETKSQRRELARNLYVTAGRQALYLN